MCVYLVVFYFFPFLFSTRVRDDAAVASLLFFQLAILSCVSQQPGSMPSRRSTAKQTNSCSAAPLSLTWPTESFLLIHHRHADLQSTIKADILARRVKKESARENGVAVYFHSKRCTGREGGSDVCVCL